MSRGEMEYGPSSRESQFGIIFSEIVFSISLCIRILSLFIYLYTNCVSVYELCCWSWCTVKSWVL